MRVVITGGAGFIGSALCRHLVLDVCWTVLNIDELTYAANLRLVLEQQRMVAAAAKDVYAGDRLGLVNV